MRSQTEWPAATSESHELLLAKLDTIWDELGEQKTNAFLVVRNDRSVHECYAGRRQNLSLEACR